MAKTIKTKGFEKLKDPEKHVVAGPRGATHQTADAAQGSLPTNQGVVVADDQNTQAEITPYQTPVDLDPSPELSR